jgi:hypothetical protein
MLSHALGFVLETKRADAVGWGDKALEVGPLFRTSPSNYLSRGTHHSSRNQKKLKFKSKSIVSTLLTCACIAFRGSTDRQGVSIGVKKSEAVGHGIATIKAAVIDFIYARMASKDILTAKHGHVA